MPAIWNMLRKTVSSLARLKARLDNPEIVFGDNCNMSWSVKLKGGGRITFGNNCLLKDGAILVPNGGSIVFGDDCSLGVYSLVNGAGGVAIGNQMRIGPHVVIYASSHRYGDLDVAIMHQGTTREPVTIEDNVWIAAAAAILGGVTVGTGAVVAAGAVVTNDVEPFSVVGGVPARVIGARKPSFSRDTPTMSVC